MPGSDRRHPPPRRPTRSEGQDHRPARRARHPSARDRRYRTCDRGPADRPHRLPTRSRPLLPTPTTTARHRCRSPAPIPTATDSPATATGSSTTRSTPSRWSRPGCPPAPAERTTTRKSTKGSPPDATRALKRHLSDHVWRIMLADETRTAPAPSEDRKCLLTNREAPHPHPVHHVNTDRRSSS